jgi:Peptidase family M48/Domain of unknown function (DUF5666)
MTMRRMRTHTFLVIAYSLLTSIAYSQGTPALLRCAFNGGLDVYAHPEPSSAIIARVKCGDRLVLIEVSSSPHVRTQDGKDGFILSHNLGQWSIVPEASPSSTAVDTARPTTSSTAATTPNQTSSPNFPATLPKVSTSSPSTSTTEPRPTAIEPVSAPRREAGRTRISEIKIHGYVTAVNSKTSFDIEDYRITRDAAFKLEFENPSPDLSFKIEDVRVGTELEIRGIYDDETGELQAKSIKVDMEQFRKLKDTAILDRSPIGVTPVSGGWRGIFFVNGQRIQVTPETKVLFKLTSLEKKLAKSATKKPKGDVAETEDSFRPLFSLAEVTSGMMMTYEGRRDIETGRILAERVEFSKNDFEKGEARLWKNYKVKVKPGDALGLKPAELSISNAGKYKLLPNDEVQEYVTNLGQSLIPAYLKAIPDSDPSKLNFRFFVIMNKEPNAFALANGIFLIHSGMFDVVENEAQLAAVIGHEIAHATQEHTWRQMNYHKNAKMALSIASAVASAYGARNLADIANMVEGAIRNGYQRSLENQADRIGLEYMVRAGYDPREAPRLWKQMTKAYGLQLTDFFWSTHDNQATRRSYLMNEIKTNYSDLNYSQVRSYGENFNRVRASVTEGSSSKKTIKVKSTKAEFGRISEGMTYEQVVSIIGTSGELIISNEIDGISTMMYSWKNANGSNINAIFQNGKLIQKAQLGLP